MGKRTRLAPRAPASKVEVGYVRVSTTEQARSGLGVADQTERIRADCERRGARLLRVVVDDVSGKIPFGDRPGGREVLELLTNGEVGTVVVAKLDRLYRSLVGWGQFLELSQAEGWSVVALDFALDSSTPTGRWMANLIMAMAQWEREIIVERTQAAMDQLRERGQLTGGAAGRTRPYGYEMDGDQLVIRPDEAEIVRELAQRAIDGESLSSLRRDLNKRGVPTVNGGPWSLTRLPQMLRAPRLAGLREGRDGELVAAPWPAILHREEWEALQRVLSGRAGNVRSTGVRTYLLTGWARCGVCGGPMRGMRLRGVPTYSCRNEGCGRVHARAARVDELVAEAVFTLVDSPDFSARLDRANGRQVAPALLEAVRRQEMRVEEIEEAYATGEMERDEYRRTRAAAAGRLDELRAQLPPARPELAALRGAQGRSVRAEWTEWPVGRQRAYVEALRPTVTILPRPTDGKLPSSRFDRRRVVVGGWAL